MKKAFPLLIQAFVLIMPWAIRGRLLSKLLGFNLAPGSYIGYSVILAQYVELAEYAYIGHLNFVNTVDELKMGCHSKIGRSNWITGAASGSVSFAGHGRKAFLHLGEHARITARHHLDCTGGVKVGSLSTIAGINSQILTHEIDIVRCKQCSGSVVIGNYCFVGTGSIILMNSRLPDCSVLGAGAVLSTGYTDTHYLYAGVPAKPIKELPPDAKYFIRKHGHVP